MKPFPYDIFKPTLIEELKDVFARFIEQDRDKRPYAFVLAAASGAGPVEFFALWAGGNTIADFESPENTLGAGMNELADFRERLGQDASTTLERAEELVSQRGGHGYSFSDTDAEALDYKYMCVNWPCSPFTDDVLPRSNAIIRDYFQENATKDRSEFVDDDYEFTEAYEQLRAEFLDHLLGCMKELRAEKYFESVYPERIFINFEVWEHYSNEEMVRIFEELNSKEEAKEFARWMLGDEPHETDA